MVALTTYSLRLDDVYIERATPENPEPIQQTSNIFWLSDTDLPQKRSYTLYHAVWKKFCWPAMNSQRGKSGDWVL